MDVDVKKHSDEVLAALDELAIIGRLRRLQKLNVVSGSGIR